MIDKSLLQKDVIIYDKQPRFFDYDYHPQKIVEIGEDTIAVLEEGYGPNGKYFTIPISNLSTEQCGNEQIIIH